ncbi:regulatory iron-sulfur-containing complex subunit RicT [Duncaniella muricolitica]|jgi:cell fate regulator YaaT (PSP1 superfamily)|uniref:regulatory iron-sulfur-containing complex subunit RicT n=1 Tax=Duncaniella muricolitica TaxID=2880704 RepID=UPI00244E2526|nr:regulatory iron-sulfur-containing complex subunit RicT [Duncaniella muricolitica]
MKEKDRRCPRGKLHCFDWLDDVPEVPGAGVDDIVEVQFKNTRKGYYRNSLGLPLEIGEMVAVEATPGHDIGCVTLTGRLVAMQMRRAGFKSDAEIKRVFRKAKPADIEKYEEARARENDTMIRARKIAESLNLNMKIGDVEYQGDGNKAIFYYIADERVDFRQLIKVLAETFKVRIEMKQIGARQEAGRIGGIGSCGRPLCCASWMTNFVSVGTSAARYQDISLNPQKLAGQCAKLKCCLNFEVDTYVESSKFLPEKNVRLETADNTYYHFKTDIFKKEITYSTDKQMAANLVTIDAERAFEVIEMNRRGEKPLKLEREGQEKQREKAKPIDLASQDDLTRFDKAKKKKKKKKPQQTGDKPQAPAAQQQPAAAGQARQEQKPQRQEGGDRKPKGQRPAGQKPQSKPQDRPEHQDKPRNEARQPEQQRRDDRQPRLGGQPQGERQGGNQPTRQPSQRPAPSSGRGPKAFRGEENGNA